MDVERISGPYESVAEHGETFFSLGINEPPVHRLIYAVPSPSKTFLDNQFPSSQERYTNEFSKPHQTAEDYSPEPSPDSFAPPYTVDAEVTPCGQIAWRRNTYVISVFLNFGL